MAKKVVRLTESQLTNLIKKIIKEAPTPALIPGQKKTDWPACIQSFISEPQFSKDAKYTIMKGDGSWQGFYFYLNGRYKSPMGQMGSYFCKGKEIILDDRGDVSKGNLPSVSQNDSDIKVISDGTKVAKLGSRGPIVQQIQAFLIGQTGINSGGPKCSQSTPQNCDGRFGENTMKAVKKFQGESGFTPDGIFGKQMAKVMSSKSSDKGYFNNNSSYY